MTPEARTSRMAVSEACRHLSDVLKSNTWLNAWDSIEASQERLAADILRNSFLMALEQMVDIMREDEDV